MIAVGDLRKIAKAHLEDAMTLLAARRFDGAVYLCGYAVEVAIKGRICRTLRWSGFPDSAGEFRDLQSFRTHELDLLLRLSGIEARIRSGFPAEWSAISGWKPELRYRRPGTADRGGAEAMLQAAKVLTRAIS